MKFQPGKSGNPSGRPVGALNKQTQMLKFLEPKAEELINKMVEMALEGDTTALKLCIERLLPKAVHKHIQFELPVYEEANSITNVTEVLNQILAGNLLPDDGFKIIKLIEQQDRRVAVGGLPIFSLP